MANHVYFKYKQHPGDLFRSTDLIELPNPDDNLEDFLIQFLRHYQSDQRISYLNDLYKLANEEFYDEKDKIRFVKINGLKTSNEIIDEIQAIEGKLKGEAFENFYYLILTKQIKIIDNG